jgi:hypothetical protein
MAFATILEDRHGPAQWPPLAFIDALEQVLEIELSTHRLPRQPFSLANVMPG